jgi:aconitate hydratase
LFSDSVTTDHISPAGRIALNSPAAKFLKEEGVAEADFNSYGSRRGNHHVMMRGTFANTRIRNALVPGSEGNVTLCQLNAQQTSFFDAAMQYADQSVPLVILAGKEYGTGSSRDWAAKGPQLLGIKAVIAESFERIHRSNLVGMGVLPLQFVDGQSAHSLGLDGSESFDIALDDNLAPQCNVSVAATKFDGSKISFATVCRIDTPVELDYYRDGGILCTVLKRIAKEKD